MLHRDDNHHSRRWRWALAVAAAVLIVWAAVELRDMQRRVGYLEEQAEQLFWELGDERSHDFPGE